MSAPSPQPPCACEGPLPLRTVLVEEAEAIALAQGRTPEIGPVLKRLQTLAPHGAAESEGQAGDAKLGVDPGADDACRLHGEAQRDLYQGLHGLDRSALCLSGGGIRSAAFCLGVVQALAIHPRPRPVQQYSRHAPGPGGGTSSPSMAGAPASEAREGLPEGPPQSSEEPEPWNRVGAADRCLLARFEYLSTVSGGGYIGSWLSSWRARASFDRIWTNLVGRPCGPDVEPGTIAWLRSYSNYLAPRTGLFSADTWAGAAIFLRNLVLNWLVILPALCLVILGLKLLSVLSIGLAVATDRSWEGGAVWLPALAAVASLGFALGFVTRNRPTRDPLDPVGPPSPGPACPEPAAARPVADHRGPDQGQVFWSYVFPSLLSAMLATQAGAATLTLARLGGHDRLTFLAWGAVLGFLVYAASWLLGRPKNPGSKRTEDRFDLGFWAGSGAVYGALVGLGLHAYTLAPRDGHWLFSDLLLPLLFGVPYLLLCQMAAEMIFLGLSNYERNADSDREWLGRAAGWVLAVAAGWFCTIFLVFAGSLFVGDVLQGFQAWIAPLGGLAGLVTALVGRSGWSSGRGHGQGRKPITANLILAVAAPVFAAALVIGLSAWLDWLLLDASLITLVRAPEMQIGEGLWSRTAGWIAAAAAVALGVAVLASMTINVNRFSIHAIYRNRLIRAFLGASALRRDADAFTDFDVGDNLPVSCLWPGEETKDPYPGPRPFHVINIALNVVSTRRKAWQERKAEPFTVSPLHSGSGCKAYRRSRHYGGQEGISLGTAMAISGAAASPNMGYHSSAAITFLMALLNVRLGWWFGNPGKEGNETFGTEGPNLALKPLLYEMFGLTTDERPYVYLSDGGHFENLGLYEMVRRRCRRIIVIDAGADPDHAFADLGNAVRKIRLDLGIAVHFRGLSALKRRPANDADLDPEAPCFAVGTIDYPAADCLREDEENLGKILYVKAAYRGIEDAGIRSYANANPAFPHETTGDQFFSESQFESYRSLGFEIMDRILDQALRHHPNRDQATLRDVFAAL